MGEAKKITIGPEMSNINTHKHKCDVCVISYQVSANLTTHNRKIHKLNECEICKLQTYGDNEYNDHKKLCKNKRQLQKCIHHTNGRNHGQNRKNCIIRETKQHR